MLANRKALSSRVTLRDLCFKEISTNDFLGADSKQSLNQQLNPAGFSGDTQSQVVLQRTIHATLVAFLLCNQHVVTLHQGTCRKFEKGHLNVIVGKKRKRKKKEKIF